jgi:hypothetical protein
MMPDDVTTNGLNRIHKDMTVYDARGDAIGKVRTVFMGNLGDDVIEMGGDNAVSPDIDLANNDSLLENIAEAFVPDNFPREVAERLLNSGYVRMDTDGILASDRYILPDQISSVTGDSVRLRVLIDDLIKT